MALEVDPYYPHMCSRDASALTMIIIPPEAQKGCLWWVLGVEVCPVPFGFVRTSPEQNLGAPGLAEGFKLGSGCVFRSDGSVV